MTMTKEQAIALANARLRLQQKKAPEKPMGERALDTVGEIAAAANRSVLGSIDFLTLDQVNNVLQLAGSDKRVPTLSDAGKALGTTQGNFMEPGLARDTAQAFGQTLPAAASLPQVARNVGTVKGAAAEILGLGSAAPTATAARQVIQEGEQAGIPVLTSDVKPPGTFVGRAAQQSGEKIPLAGTGPVREEQQRMRQEAVEQVASRYGEYSYNTIVNSLREKKDAVKSAAGNVLQATGQKLDNAGNIGLSNTEAAIKAAKVELSKKGVIGDSGALSDLKTLISAIEEAPQTFTSLKENRTAFGDILKSVDRADRSQLTSRAKALLTGVRQGMTRDMETFARENLDSPTFEKWRRANAVYAEQAKQMKKTKLKGILDKGDVTPEQVKSMLFSQNPSEQRLLYKSLGQSGRENARAAIISKMVEQTARTGAGLTPNAFLNQMKKHTAQIDTFFKGDEKRQLRGLMRVLDSTKRAQDAAVSTPTGQQVIPAVTALGIYIDPVTAIAGGGTLGGLARLYESAPVRNALLNVGSLPENSPKYGEALLAAHLVIVAESAAETSQADTPQ